MDTLTPEERSALMSKIRGKNTKPELLVRSMLHRAGYRFSLHRKDLPGKPDITLRKHKTVVFVHGCFWHRHKHCRVASTPKSNTEFWEHKFERNVANDRKHKRELRKLGWNVIVIWECELKDPEKVLVRLMNELTPEKVLHYPTAEDTSLIAAEAKAKYITKGKKGK
ncbi:very short patch repair endonuclease [Pontiella desulfatans]|nr:DNA mismatch endonuclease Vsr [Pontiella desulfatans]